MSSANQLLMMAEAQDHYIETCDSSAMNASARRECMYVPSFLEDLHAERLTTIVRSLDLLRDTDTVILSGSADNGYPHTRPRALICLPASFVKSSNDDQLIETLCHEAMHVHQRLNPAVWKAMCKSEGWTPLSYKNIPSRFIERCRINPDTFYDTPFWAWDKHHAPLPMFKNGFLDKVSLGDVTIEWLDLRTGALFHSPPDSFTEKYGTPPQAEHPYEIYAVLFANEGIRTRMQLALKLKELTID